MKKHDIYQDVVNNSADNMNELSATPSRKHSSNGETEHFLYKIN
jgi:hypothetical protein